MQILKPGLLTTIQDMGRRGFRHTGIGPGGAADAFAAQVANLLVNNDMTEGVLESHFPPLSILFEEACMISLTGADFGASINTQPVALWQPIVVQQGDLLELKRYRSGARVYIAVSGGIDAMQWMGSNSTEMKLKQGGFNGRALAKGDLLQSKLLEQVMQPRAFPSITQAVAQVYAAATSLRCITSVEWGRLDAQSMVSLVAHPFKLTPASDRMGCRLTGPPLSLSTAVDMISSPVDAGTVQLLPNGQLVVLLADHQTTGGYPRIVNVISADLPLIAQLPIHASFQFKLVSVAVAEEAVVARHQLLNHLKTICYKYYGEYRS